MERSSSLPRVRGDRTMTYLPAEQIPQTRWARTVDGACIAYQDFGEGPVTLVVIHGWVSHLEIYWEQPRFARFMRRLAKNMRVLALRQARRRHVGPAERSARPRRPDGRRARRHGRRRRRERGHLRLGRWRVRRWPRFFAATSPGADARACASTARSTTRRSADYPWARPRRSTRGPARHLTAAWGDENARVEFIRDGFGERPPGRASRDDPAFLRWCATFARCAATPASYEAFDRMWYETDVRDVLPSRSTCPRSCSSTGGRRPEWYAQMQRVPPPTIPAAPIELVAGSDGVVWVDDPEPLVRAIERVHRLRPARGGRARPHAGDRPVHRRRRLDRQGVRGRRRLLDGAPREAQRDGARASSPAIAATR